jgi:hypothetical protein
MTIGAAIAQQSQIREVPGITPLLDEAPVRRVQADENYFGTARGNR